MKRLMLACLVLLGAHALPAAPLAPTDSFVTYMKAVTNPHGFGLREGRYYPYSTRYGRRIGYARPAEDKALYARGETPAEAEHHLREGLAATLKSLEPWLARTYPSQPFSSLDPRAQEILLDRAFTGGVENLPPAFCEAVFRADWDTLLDRHLYVRGPGGWPDTTQNRAFAFRWIYGETGAPLRPLKTTVR
jgi:hypothetical protein